MKKNLSFLLSLPLAVVAVSACSVGDVSPFLDKITSSVSGWMGISTVIAAVLEVVVRLWPTVNPASVLLVAAKISHSLGDLFAAVSSFLDGVLQNTKPQAPKNV